MSVAILEEACPETAIVLGSGLGPVAETLGIEVEVPFAEVPGLSASTVPGHAGRFALSRVAGKPILIAQGRRHFYEGISLHELTAGIRFMHGLGVRRVVLTNAAGAINSAFEVGELMLVTDHLNLLGFSPLAGVPQFCDMTEVYGLAWRQTFLAEAAALGIPLHQGVYAAVPGPQYETPAEIRMLRTLGADAVGMSTVPEAIQARALGMEVAALSMLTNWASGLRCQTLSHEEVLTVADTVGANLARLLQGVLSDTTQP